MKWQRLRIGMLSVFVALGAIGIAGSSPRQGGAAKDDTAAELRRAAERFIAAADRADAAAIAAAYDPEFTCVRVADEGGFARLSREQMLGFFNRPAAKGQGQGQGHAIPTKETTIHHAEALGDTGFVLLTRIKDLGHGWEPMFYTLVWKRHDGGWRLLREYVHQKSIPRRL
jgi:ketosteroid isomerase-like protein